MRKTKNRYNVFCNGALQRMPLVYLYPKELVIETIAKKYDGRQGSGSCSLNG